MHFVKKMGPEKMKMALSDILHFTLYEKSLSH